MSQSAITACAWLAAGSRRFVGRLFLACVAGALAAGVGLATPAWANVLWSSEQTMVEFNYLRYTFIYDSIRPSSAAGWRWSPT
jgi:hypothetical protein